MRAVKKISKDECTQAEVICSSCVLPRCSSVRIDNNGLCSICNSELQFKHLSRGPDNETLSKLLDKIKSAGISGNYDCIVGWSGGRDSTALLYELTKIHKFRCIAVFFKTPFTPAEIIENVRSISKKLGVVLIEKETPKNHLKIASFCLKQYQRTNQPILLNLACASCKYLNRDMFKLARKMKIKSIIYAGNNYEGIPLGPADIKLNMGNRYSFLSMLIDNIIRVMKGFTFLVKSPSLIKYLPVFFKATVLYVNPYTIYLRLRYPEIFRFDYYFYADWDEKKVSSILQELEWKLPEGCVTQWKADCVFEAVKDEVYRRNQGFSYRQAMYSNLIRAGKMSRPEALLRLEKESCTEPRLLKALKLCRMSPELFMQNS